MTLAAVDDWNPGETENLPHGGHPCDTSDLDAAGCHQLWVTVLAQQWDASFGEAYRWEGNRKLPVRNEAQKWMGGRDFREVCHLIGLDPDAVFDRWRECQRVYDTTGIRPPPARFNVSLNWVSDAND